MFGRWKSRLPVLMVVAACYVLLYAAARYNLAVSAETELQKPITIIIDAGHGGEDGGAVSASGLKESVINLEISRRLEDFLALCGIRPMMMRKDDVSLHTDDATSISEKKVSDLKNRVAMVNSEQNAILLSIHQNHFSQEKYSGAQVFYADTPGSKQLAQKLQDNLRSGLDPRNERQIKPADSVYLMREAACTSVLIECGFLSNASEAYLLKQDSYQKKLACAIAAGLIHYLEGEQNFEV